MEKRLDVLLAERGIYASRQKAKQAIESQRVTVNGVLIEKAAYVCDEKAEIVGKPFEFVSRGGFKLQKAIEEFEIGLSGKVCLDIGASTGGFTDVCLQNGARKVFAVDTGEGQLAEELQKDLRVVNMEKTNFLNCDERLFADVEFVCIDVSFVSLTKLMPKLAEIFLIKSEKDVEIVALIKPQFECGREYARKHKGIVKDEKVHKKVIENICQDAKSFGFMKMGLIQSPIKGGDGNVEFLIWLKAKRR